MSTKTTDKAKAKPKTKSAKRVKLKPTTRAMLYHAKFMRRLYPHGRDSHARIYRDARRLGESNLSILDINQPTAAEKAKRRAEEYAAIEAAAAEHTTMSELPVDAAPHEDSQALPGQAQVVDEHDSTSPPTLTSRPRRPRVEPQKRQATFSFGSD